MHQKAEEEEEEEEEEIIKDGKPILNINFGSRHSSKINP